MPIRYFFKQLLLPPGGLLLLLLAAWWLRRRSPRLAVFCFMLGFGGLWLMNPTGAVITSSPTSSKHQRDRGMCDADVTSTMCLIPAALSISVL